MPTVLTSPKSPVNNRHFSYNLIYRSPLLRFAKSYVRIGYESIAGYLCLWNLHVIDVYEIFMFIHWVFSLQIDLNPNFLDEVIFCHWWRTERLIALRNGASFWGPNDCSLRLNWGQNEASSRPQIVITRDWSHVIVTAAWCGAKRDESSKFASWNLRARITTWIATSIL